LYTVKKNDSLLAPRLEPRKNWTAQPLAALDWKICTWRTITLSWERRRSQGGRNYSWVTG